MDDQPRSAAVCTMEDGLMIVSFHLQSGPESKIEECLTVTFYGNAEVDVSLLEARLDQEARASERHSFEPSRLPKTSLEIDENSSSHVECQFEGLILDWGCMVKVMETSIAGSR